MVAFRSCVLPRDEKNTHSLGRGSSVNIDLLYMSE